VRSTDHSMATVFRIGLQDAVGCRIVSSRIHGVGPCLVEGCGEPHIPSCPTGNDDSSSHLRCLPLNNLELGMSLYKTSSEAIETLEASVTVCVFSLLSFLTRRVHETEEDVEMDNL
jgi:hypothetical protein